MSLSSLQAQLASISNRSGKHPGSTFASSRKQNEAVGRGFNFSVQHGYAIRSDTKFYQPSILAETARQAADIPLQTLQENFHTAMKKISECFQPGVEVDFIFAMSSKLCGKDQASRKSIQDLLTFLSTILAEASTTVEATPCFHVLEYLLRRYNIHVECMEEFLWTLIPTAGRFPAVFFRALQLVDLASNQSYVWMRSYAADVENDEDQRKKMGNQKGNDGSVSLSSRIPPRRLLAQHVMKKIDILGRVCRLATAVSKWHTNDESEARSGIAHILSYTAALVVEGLAWVRTQPDVDRQLRENVLRTLFPTVLAACADSKLEDWRGWGHVIASVVTETMELTPKALGNLTTHMFEAINDSSPLSVKGDVVAAIISVLFPYGATSLAHDNELSAFLPLLNGSVLGCHHLPLVTRSACLHAPYLPVVLGHLYNDRNIVVTPFVVAICVANLRVQDDGDSTGAIKPQNQALMLLQEESLRDVWKRDRGIDLVSSLACWIVEQAPTMDQDSLNRATNILRELHRLDAFSCERGIGAGLQRDDGSETWREQLKALLMGTVPLLDHVSDRQLTLPPRVAIEHADSSARLQAIEKLTLLYCDADTAGDGVIETFLRRLATDDEPNVVIALCKSLVSMVATKEHSNSNSINIDFDSGEFAVEANHRWTNELLARPTEKVIHEVVCNCLDASGSVYSCMRRSDHKCKQLILEFIIAHLHHSVEDIAMCAQRALEQALRFEHPGQSKPLNASPRALLLNQPDVIKRLKDSFFVTTFKGEEVEVMLRKLCAITVVRLAIEEKPFAHSSAGLCEAVFDLSLTSLGEPSLDEHIAARGLSWALQKLTPTGQKLVDTLIALAGAGSDHVFLTHIDPLIVAFLSSISDEKGQRIFPPVVLLEAAVRKPSTKASARLTALARRITVDNPEGSWLTFVPALYLLEQSNEVVRDEARLLLISASSSLEDHCKDHSEKAKKWECICELGRKMPKIKTAVVWENNTFIGDLLSSCTSQPANGDQFRQVFIVLCGLSSAACANVHVMSTSDAFNSGWLPLRDCTGGMKVSARLLELMEEAGEQSFPLLMRWKLFGQPFLKHVIENERKPPTLLIDLLVLILNMLKGITIIDPKVLILSGPNSTGRRTRSYSFGKAEGTSLISPYPKEMIDFVTQILGSPSVSGCTSMVADLVLEHVLANKSWSNDVFANLRTDEKIRLVRSMLVRFEKNASNDDFFFAFPLDGTTITNVLKSSKSHVSTAILADYIRVNAYSFAQQKSASLLMHTLTSGLENTAAAVKETSDEREASSHSILLAIDAMLEANAAIDTSRLNSLVDILSGMICGSKGKSRGRDFRALGRTRILIQNVMTSLCEKYPSTVTKNLVSIMLCEIPSSDNDRNRSRSNRSTFCRLVPVYMKHARSAGLTLHHLFKEFLQLTNGISDESLRFQIHADMVRSLVRDPLQSDMYDPGAVDNAAVGGFVISFLAQATQLLTKLPSRYTVEATDMIRQCDAYMQAASIHTMLQYVNFLIPNFLDIEGVREVPSVFGVEESLTPTPENIVDYFPSSREMSNGDCSRILIEGILQVSADVLSSPPLQTSVSMAHEKCSSLFLSLWQELLIVESLVKNTTRLSSTFDDSLLRKACQCRESIQEVLPLPIFLASVSSILESAGSDELRAMALRLAASRSLQPGLDTADKFLFLDLYPAINMIMSDTTASDVLRTSAVTAVEHFARSVFTKTGEKSCLLEGFENFMSALDQTCLMLDSSSERINKEGIQAANAEIFCSSVLCCGSLVRIAGPRSLPRLPNMISSIFQCIDIADRHVRSSASISTEVGMLLHSILRALIAIVDTVPLFLPPYLERFLSRTGLFSDVLRSHPMLDTTLKKARDRLDELLTCRIPTRLFIPEASTALIREPSLTARLTLLDMLKASIVRSSGSESVAHTGTLLRSITVAFEHAGPSDERIQIIESTCDLLQTFVMNLSEIQLRRVFISIKEWRAGVDSSECDSRVEQRYAFWMACNRLSKVLRSIFLPCLTLAIDDAVAELSTAALLLCRSELRDHSKSRKRRRFEAKEIEHSIESLRTLQPLLSCLESSLIADARQGGHWVRADENQKYEALLDPLGKLLFSDFPPEFTNPQNGTSSYQAVVEGVSTDTGSVVGCLTALASAAGNDQLWKPLNHEVLQACSCQSRVEVRRAGLVCLRSLMKTLGEEYMVLLPECLPVLSERMEDGDDYVSGLAKEIVNIAEELIGESLQDSL